MRLATLALLWAACSQRGAALPDAAAQRLHSAGVEPEGLGDLVYEGRVQPRGDDAPAWFTYERRVQSAEVGWRGVHLTYDTDQTPIVLHVATYTDRYELLSFEEVHGQTGLVGQSTIGPDGELTLTVTRRGQTETFSEGPGDPVHTGPSLFGFLGEHWDALLQGDAIGLRFVVMAAGRTYRFVVRLESTDRNITVFRMTARNVGVRLAVPAMRITFDTPSRAPLRFEGLVPPMAGPPDALRRLDARVDYTLQSGAYR